MNAAAPEIIDLGRLDYDAAYQVQLRHLDQVLNARDSGRPDPGRLLLVEHHPVITISRRQGARSNLLASPELLAQHGVAIAETDRGGDITYHGPGQLVIYPILDLNHLNLGLHAYMRLLESAVIDACATWGLTAERDPGATGVWVHQHDTVESRGPDPIHRQPAKIAAMGVRVKRWASMHGLSFNLDPDLAHFDLIIPCGLVGKKVTTLALELARRGSPIPTMRDVKSRLSSILSTHLIRAADTAARLRDAAIPTGTHPRTDSESS